MKNKTSKNKTSKNKTSKNKTSKNRILYKKRKDFVDKILYEWIKQTNGRVHMDTTTQYIHDYYLSLNNKDDYEYHVHLALHHYNEKDNINKKHIRFGYIFKKYKNQHSKFKLISIYDNPQKLVKKMIQEFKKYLEK